MLPMPFRFPTLHALPRPMLLPRHSRIPTAAPSGLVVFLLAFAFAGFHRPSSLGAQELEELPVVTEDVRYESGDVTLAALYLRPDPRSGSGAAIPGAVIIQGSGDSGRDNQWSRMIADAMVQAGFGVLLTDKRGVGASEGEWRSVGFHTLADDALAGARYLESRPEVDPESVGLVGLSQGGWVAPIAAASSDRIAFVVNVSGASVSFAEQSFHEMANTARQEGLPPELVDEVLVLYGEEDERDNVPVGESVRRLEFVFDRARKENHRIVVLPGAGHGFLDFSGDDHAEHGLRSDFVHALTTWLVDDALD